MQPTLASLIEVNHSLRQEVVDLLLSIAVLKDAPSMQPGSNAQPGNIGKNRADVNIGLNSPRSASLPKKKARGEQSVRRCDRQL